MMIDDRSFQYMLIKSIKKETLHAFNMFLMYMTNLITK